ncbi:putative inactive receptor kinase At2g26730 [Tasmannia lanceolata]|uniref:putative inactive receptor kinase At2g26730 n=1 Tax=Tasmannia lanceolata TaxID=3420 RepID=UPI0040648842
MVPIILAFLYSFYSLLVVLTASFIIWIRRKLAPIIEKPVKFTNGNARYGTPPMSMLEIKVTMPSKVIFGNEGAINKYDPSEFAQIPVVRLGEGTLGPLFKAVLNSGSIVTVRKIRGSLVKSSEFDRWIKFFGGIRDAWLSPILFSFWYGSEAFLIYQYECLGSLEDLLHGKEGIQFTPLNWGIRLYIALCTSMALAALHARTSDKGEAMVCGVIKASNILIRTDFSAYLSGYETPYLASLAMIIRRNPGRVAPELVHLKSSDKFTQKSDVYSFGVLLLELITGEKSMVSDKEEEVSLVEYVQLKKEKEGLQGIYDHKMSDIKDNMSNMVEIAELCLSENPNERPTMESVVKMIQQLQEDRLPTIS